MIRGGFFVVFVVFVLCIAAFDQTSLARQNRRKPAKPLEIYSELPHSALRDLYALGSKGGCLSGGTGWSLFIVNSRQRRQQNLVATMKLD